MGYDNWLTTTPADRGHEDECNCDICHEVHKKLGCVRENAELPDFDCCRVELEEMIDRGDWCRICDTDAYMHRNGHCGSCEQRKAEPKDRNHEAAA